MSKPSLTQASPNGNGLTPDPRPPAPTKVCLRRGCVHQGDPQPAKYFNGRHGVVYDDCRDCRHGPRDRRRGPDDDAGLNGYGPVRRPEWVLPPGCEVLEVQGVPGLVAEAQRNGCDEGMGVPILTDPQGRPVVKSGFELKPGEVCYVVR